LTVELVGLMHNVGAQWRDKFEPQMNHFLN